MDSSDLSLTYLVNVKCAYFDSARVIVYGVQLHFQQYFNIYSDNKSHND